MAPPLDFPPNPSVGFTFTAPNGVVYIWDGYAWTVGYYDNPEQSISSVGGILAQVRTLLQDTDLTSGQYRYSTDSIITNLNQCMSDLFRLRPDLFLANDFKIPAFTVDHLEAEIGLEAQYIPPVVYYVVGLTQVRDDEQNQDARALGFLKVFQNAVVSGGIAA